jgi:putative acetyltransferase
MVERAAFARAEEADLVDRLRASVRPYVSLVAEVDAEVVGHIFFSPVTIAAAPANLQPMGLAPMAVLPARQRLGIGGGLIRAGLDACRGLGAGAVVVLGHAGYYPRFGFVPAVRFGLRCEYPVPDEAFMALELRSGALSGVAGLVRYAPQFAGV